MSHSPRNPQDNFLTRMMNLGLTCGYLLTQIFQDKKLFWVQTGYPWKGKDQSVEVGISLATLTYPLLSGNSGFTILAWVEITCCHSTMCHWFPPQHLEPRTRPKHPAQLQAELVLARQPCHFGPGQHHCLLVPHLLQSWWSACSGSRGGGSTACSTGSAGGSIFGASSSNTLLVCLLESLLLLSSLDTCPRLTTLAWYLPIIDWKLL